MAKKTPEQLRAEADRIEWRAHFAEQARLALRVEREAHREKSSASYQLALQHLDEARRALAKLAGVTRDGKAEDDNG